MNVERADLAKIFPGQWDGGDTEFHGLVKAKGTQLRVECIRRDDHWTVSIFEGGAALATAEDEDVRKAIAQGLKDALRQLVQD